MALRKLSPVRVLKFGGTSVGTACDFDPTPRYLTLRVTFLPDADRE